MGEKNNAQPTLMEPMFCAPLFSRSIMLLVDRKTREERHELHDDLLRKEKELLSQEVCILKPLFASCHVDPSLAGCSVKVKCRSKVATLLKSSKYKVRTDGELSLCEIVGSALYEGDDTLHFQLCRARLFQCCAVVATGALSLDSLFRTAGLNGETTNWIVDLHSKDGQKLGSLKVNLRCGTGSLEGRGGGVAAMKTHKLPPRPELFCLYEGGSTGWNAVKEAEKYAASCCAASEMLHNALLTARASAGSKAVRRSFSGASDECHEY